MASLNRDSSDIETVLKIKNILDSLLWLQDQATCEEIEDKAAQLIENIRTEIAQFNFKNLVAF